MLAAGVLLAFLAAAPPDAEQVARALDEVWREDDYQRDLPEPRERKGPATPESGMSTQPSGFRGGSGPASGLATALLWALGAAGAIVIAVALAEGLRGREKERPRVASAARAPPADPEVVEAPLADADAFVRQGRFGEAIHALLLRLLGELSARTTPPIPDSLTSREIVARVAVPDAARAPLAHLVGAVETSHFGGDLPSRDDYDRCLDRYRAFAAAYATPS